METVKNTSLPQKEIAEFCQRWQIGGVGANGIRPISVRTIDRAFAERPYNAEDLANEPVGNGVQAMKTYTIIFIGVILATGLVGCAGSSEPIHQQVEVGQTKQEIIEAVGEPDSKENTKKNVEYIFGPEEEFWDKIPMGADLEVWGYEDEGGHLNLYFVDGSDRLDYKAFAPEGVVY